MMSSARAFGARYRARAPSTSILPSLSTCSSPCPPSTEHEHRALGLNIKTDENYLKSKLLFIRYKRLISKVNELLDLKNLDIVFNALHTDRISLKI